MRTRDSVVRSRKEAFCLAPTDAIDLTMAGASWQPTSTGLHSACGNYTAPAVREVLDAGWGDTYLQTKPGESFDLQGLPNGKYFIEVTVNPRSKLYESDTDNNVAYRKIWIGGKPGDRTVRVPEVGLVGSP